ncbi:hypothetical protein HX021_13850, partial [Sphingobacterium sp. N143]|uniref:hypothetical protein n=1 Tax=Sphingobacterium sp. N143 TaxID=2746727 RepID=UPI002577002E
RQSRWYCRNRWESRSVPFFTQKPLLETVKGFLRWDSFDLGAVPVEQWTGMNWWPVLTAALSQYCTIWKATTRFIACLLL